MKDLKTLTAALKIVDAYTVTNYDVLENDELKQCEVTREKLIDCVHRNVDNTQYDTTLNSYDEPKALQQLLTSANNELTRINDEYTAALNVDKNSELPFSEFTITVGGVQTAFYLGGPQFDALLAFIQHIADENGYSVDVNSCTVEE